MLFPFLVSAKGAFAKGLNDFRLLVEIFFSSEKSSSILRRGLCSGGNSTRVAKAGRLSFVVSESIIWELLKHLFLKELNTFIISKQ